MNAMPTVMVVRRQAMCSCGWSGRGRMLKAFALVDAWMHSGRTAHQPAVPLVVA
ncbi:hypothetical protein H7J86_24180 [Mycobacterium hackensackense]|uniref:hypothetical protein n=1 Tax=Mycobacterium hackensackense TaxID=228909 RepID=UPI002265D142|nr:hypothetical protein [Mycobacterium hackensackense]MCV7255265.1 hypothetical protein [Mycobacterium hackensackense]